MQIMFIAVFYIVFVVLAGLQVGGPFACQVLGLLTLDKLYTQHIHYFDLLFVWHYFSVVDHVWGLNEHNYYLYILSSDLLKLDWFR